MSGVHQAQEQNERIIALLEERSSIESSSVATTPRPDGAKIESHGGGQ